MTPVILMVEASDDVEKISDFYDLQEAGVGDYFKESLSCDLDRLAWLHGVHPKRFGFYKVKAEHFPHGIYYLLENDMVAVYAVLDLRRNPAWLKAQLSKRKPRES